LQLALHRIDTSDATRCNAMQNETVLIISTLTTANILSVTKIFHHFSLFPGKFSADFRRLLALAKISKK
jgi:hypothetical protein